MTSVSKGAETVASKGDKKGGEIGAIRCAGWVGGFATAYFGSRNISIFAAKESPFVPLSFLFLWVLAFMMVGRSPCAAEAWRRLLFTSAAFSFLFPISGWLASSHYLGRGPAVADDSGFLLACLAFGGFFVGSVFIGIAVRIGRRTKASQPSAEEEGL